MGVYLLYCILLVSSDIYCFALPEYHDCILHCVCLLSYSVVCYFVHCSCLIYCVCLLPYSVGLHFVNFVSCDFLLGFRNTVLLSNCSYAFISIVPFSRPFYSPSALCRFEEPL